MIEEDYKMKVDKLRVFIVTIVLAISAPTLIIIGFLINEISKLI